jgi:hypothetical protein
VVLHLATQAQSQPQQLSTHHHLQHQDHKQPLLLTPTTSTSDAQHHTTFTHHFDEKTIEHAKRNNGEYEIDNPREQEAARGKEYAQPSPIMIMKKPKKGNRKKS